MSQANAKPYTQLHFEVIDCFLKKTSKMSRFKRELTSKLVRHSQNLSIIKLFKNILKIFLTDLCTIFDREYFVTKTFC